MQNIYPQMSTFFDEKRHSAWLYMRAEPVPCFTPVLLQSLADFLTMSGRQIVQMTLLHNAI